MDLPLDYIFIHIHPDYAYGEIRRFAPGTPSITLRQTTLHTDPQEAVADIGGYATWHHLAIVRTSTIVHDHPFS